MSKKVYPVPEAILEGPWNVVASGHGITGPRVEIGANNIAVPLSEDPYDRVIRTHEMAHVAYSPRKMEDIPKDVEPLILAAVEDARVNTLATLAGIDLEPGYLPALVQSAIERVRKSEDYRMLALLNISFAHIQPTATQGYGFSVKGLPGKEQRRLNDAINGTMERLAALRYGFDGTVAAARWLEDYLDRVDQERDLEKKAEAAAKKTADEVGARDREHRRAAESSYKRARERLKGLADYPIEEGGAEGHESEGLVPWGRMRIQEPPRGIRLPGILGRRRRPYDTGDALSYPWRLHSDMKVFGRKLRSMGGAVLIDGSGSMHITPGEILKILVAAPGATIAIYGAQDLSEGYGTLRILARKGLRVADAQVRSPGGGNVIDYPALLWLARQEGPHIWVSDTLVTGIGDSFSYVNQAQCIRLCRRYRILVLPNVTEAIDHLRKLRLIATGVHIAA